MPCREGDDVVRSRNLLCSARPTVLDSAAEVLCKRDKPGNEFVHPVMAAAKAAEQLSKAHKFFQELSTESDVDFYFSSVLWLLPADTGRNRLQSPTIVLLVWVTYLTPRSG